MDRNLSRLLIQISDIAGAVELKYRAQQAATDGVWCPVRTYPACFLHR